MKTYDSDIMYIASCLTDIYIPNMTKSERQIAKRLVTMGILVEKPGTIEAEAVYVIKVNL